MEKPGEHFTAGEGGEEVGFVAFDDSGALVPVVVAVKKDMVDGVTLAAMGTCRVIPGVPPEAGGVISVKHVTGDELEGCGLVCAGVCSHHSFDEWMKGNVRGIA